MAEPIVFQDENIVYYADTCEPLKAAALRAEITLRGWSRGSYPGIPLPKGMMPQLRSVGVWDASRPQSWGLDSHCNEGLEFTYVARGQTAFEVDGAHWGLRQGNLTITRPWQFHRVGNPTIGASRLIWIIIDVEVRRPNEVWRWPDWLILSDKDQHRLTRLLRHNEQPVWKADENIRRCFLKIDALLESENPRDNQTRLTLYINDLVVSIMEMLNSHQIPLDEHLSTTQRVVEMFLASLPKHIGLDWDLNMMANECGLSRSQFSTYCKQITNMTPIAYLNSCRLKAAATLLLEQPSMNITEIALGCGFGSGQYMATMFKRYRGCTPSQFRQANANLPAHQKQQDDMTLTTGIETNTNREAGSNGSTGCACASP